MPLDASTVPLLFGLAAKLCRLTAFKLIMRAFELNSILSPFNPLLKNASFHHLARIFKMPTGTEIGRNNSCLSVI